MSTKSDDYGIIGKRQPKLDGPLKATGRSQFTDDFYLLGMLHGKIVRSPVARGRILSIDTSRAERLPGVKAVVTHRDCPGMMVHPDRELLCSDEVRFIGDEVAAVAAVDEDTAAEAAELIRIEYETLKPVFSFAEAVAEGAPLLAKGREDNYIDKFHVDLGEVDKAFAEADHVRVGEFTFNPNHNCFAEHHVVVADYSAPGKLSMWTPNQSPLQVQKKLGGVLGISESDVRVFNLNSGGAFSGRIGPRKHNFIAAILSRKAGWPVKIRCTADEEFLVYPGSGSFKYSIKTGVMKDGTLKATQANYRFECGAYWDPSWSALLRHKYHMLQQVYHMEAVRWQETAVLTNNPPNMFPHGAALLQIKLAQEMELDLIAREIGMDPMQLKLKNAVAKGDTTLSKVRYASCGLRAAIKKVSTRSAWKKKFGKLPPFRGIGIACGSMNSGGPDKTGALIKIGEDGKLSLFVGLSDMGQGSHTAMAMIAAETLGVTVDDVTVVAGDSAAAPFDMGAYAQRGTFFTGNAVKLACLDAKKQLAVTAAKRLGVKSSSLILFRNGKVYPKGAPEKAESFAAIVSYTLDSQAGKHVMGKGLYHPSPTSTAPLISALAYSFGAQVAEVEVDPDTGIVTLLKVTHAHDVGRAINPLAVEGQIDGQVFSGMGQILTEECVMEGGKVLNPSLLNYHLPRTFEVPEMDCSIIETHDPYGPFGAKEVGEGPLVCTMAIANAVADAIGCPLREFPITPERVLRALRGKEKRTER